jgi:hypothetical protein
VSVIIWMHGYLFRLPHRPKTLGNTVSIGTRTAITALDDRDCIRCGEVARICNVRIVPQSSRLRSVPNKSTATISHRDEGSRRFQKEDKS